jgi:hypothetical protein
MKSFIRVVELWVPDRARTKLEYGGGLYDRELHEFREISEFALFAYDEGLPGKAWAAGHPVILTEFSDSYFKRADEAREMGLTCGVALPVFAGEFLIAVMVLLCGGDEQHVGAIELWHNDADLSHEMGLVDGYYGNADAFEFDSRHTKFPRGFGLPGRTWKADSPIIIKDIDRAKPFLRSKEAVEIGINFGLGIPYIGRANETWVMSFLSARSTPIAHRFEIWVPNASRDALVFQSGYCSKDTDVAAAFADKSIRKSEGTIGGAWMTGSPAIQDDLRKDTSVAAKAAVKAGLKQIVVLPVIRNAQLQAAVCWYL